MPFHVWATGPEFLPLLEALLAQLIGTECRTVSDCWWIKDILETISSKLQFRHWKQEQIWRVQIRWVRRVGHHSHLFSSQTLQLLLPIGEWLRHRHHGEWPNVQVLLCKSLACSTGIQICQQSPKPQWRREEEELINYMYYNHSWWFSAAISHLCLCVMKC